MSLAIKYETVDDANLRLRDTVVLYKGEPVFIHSVRRAETPDEIFRVYYSPLPLSKAKVLSRGEDADKRKYISSKHFDICPFRMGYVNSQSKGAFYCCRLPNRVQRQGLSAENFKAITCQGKQVDFRTFCCTPEVIHMVNNVYPIFQTALKALDKVFSIAFHYDFALVKDSNIESLIYLFHRGEKAGFLNDGKIVLGKKFKCLKEGLIELGLNIKE